MIILPTKEVQKLKAKLKYVNKRQHELYTRFDDMPNMTPARIRKTNIDLDILANEEKAINKELDNVSDRVSLLKWFNIPYKI